ncbi:hypothetical protein [Asticcacaulis benevestitus]|uniref:Secreted protein n=1 Tax=Asticcacaulis benevestitus DSM 16100 = ATCC BAA-896 TaxID=1121022 RepID=V4P979_9CAUL|nr:hypothetical protein [Asticcacaulis benevestitus]ESQ90482.1 hypothetical protein ABENE_12225 [Asticcacaulis benevestitus DSM 16100 = ATCC BAA-896]
MKSVIQALLAPALLTASLIAGTTVHADPLRLSSGLLAIQPAKGQWSVVVTTVTTGAPFNTIRVCLTADHTWYNTVQRSGSQPGSGKWLTSGASLLWRGNMGQNLDDAAVLHVDSASSMSGPLMQWVKDTTDTTNTAIDNVFANSAWTHVSDTCDDVLK